MCENYVIIVIGSRYNQYFPLVTFMVFIFPLAILCCGCWLLLASIATTCLSRHITVCCTDSALYSYISKLTINTYQTVQETEFGGLEYHICIGDVPQINFPACALDNARRKVLSDLPAA